MAASSHFLLCACNKVELALRCNIADLYIIIVCTYMDLHRYIVEGSCKYYIVHNYSLLVEQSVYTGMLSMLGMAVSIPYSYCKRIPQKSENYY